MGLPLRSLVLPLLLGSVSLVSSGVVDGGAREWSTALVPKSFDMMLNSQENVVAVLFHAGWCPPCVRFGPIWERIARTLRNTRKLRIDKVDCLLHHDVCVRSGVHHLPSIRLFHVPGEPDSEKRGGLDTPPEVQGTEGEFITWFKTSAAKLGGGEAGVRSLRPPPRADSTEQAVSPPEISSMEVQQPEKLGSTAASSASSHGVAGDQTADHLVDAEVALLFSLRQGVFLGASDSGGSSNPLADPLSEPFISAGALTDLAAWLKFLSIGFPSERSRNDLSSLANTVISKQKATGSLGQSDWNLALQKQGLAGLPFQAGQAPEPYWRLCSGYTCGLWTLFHTLAIAAGEGQIDLHKLGELAKPKTLADATTQPAFLKESSGMAGMPEDNPASYALLMIRTFVDHFFGCGICRKHFLRLFDSCDFGRCDWRPDNKRGAALWLWQTHNHITAHIARETGVSLPDPWPPASECAACRGGSYTYAHVGWDLDEVYMHLRRTYWPTAYLRVPDDVSDDAHAVSVLDSVSYSGTGGSVAAQVRSPSSIAGVSVLAFGGVSLALLIFRASKGQSMTSRSVKASAATFDRLG